ncbi:DUF4190 domain-containing protein [Demequina sp. NBRC 110051]|uniref:DUF4190 domain-containing protein n=1 Tax=Demequina sp. NBRC 110051 TaxID=1570340 RepID=UPI00135644AC|nr:DUF4190 domain-containing protein [Demequina sp. NBRC 110051]
MSTDPYDDLQRRGPARDSSEFVAPTMNALAVVAIVGSVLGLIGLMPLIGSIVGIVGGRIAQRQIAERGQDGGSMARIAVIMGWVGLSLALLVILFVAVLIATASAPQ